MSIYDGLPKSIRVGPYDMNLDIDADLRDEKGDKLWGQHSHGEVIRLHGGQPNVTFAIDTLLHEIIHAIDRCAGIHVENQDDEMERMASAIATGLTQVLKDNPPLVTWLIGALGSASSGTKTCPCFDSWDGSAATTPPDWLEHVTANTRS